MKFEKVSLETFRKDLKKIEPYFTEELIETAYAKIRIPERATARSAGYDFVTPVRIYLPAKRDIIIPTGIKCFFSCGSSQLASEAVPEIITRNKSKGGADELHRDY